MNNININIKMSDILFMFAMVFVLGFPGASMIKAVAILLFFGYMMLAKLTHLHSIRNNFHFIGAFLFLGYAYLSKKWAYSEAAADEQLTNVVWTVLLATSVSTYVMYNKYTLKDITNRLMPIALVFILNVIANGSFESDRLSVGINENVFGRLAASLAALLFYQCKQDRWKNKFMVTVMGILLLFVFLSGSRTSVLVAGVYIIAITTFEHPTQDTLKILGRFIAGVVVITLAYLLLTKVDFLYTSIGHRLEAMMELITGESSGDASAEKRLRMIEEAEQLFLSHPILGVGVNNFKFVSSFITYAHNNYYELAACLGIVGLAIYYGPWVVFLKNAIIRWSKDEAGMIIPLTILITSLVGDFGSVSYFNPGTHVYIGLAVGFVMQKSSKINSENQENTI